MRNDLSDGFISQSGLSTFLEKQYGRGTKEFRKTNELLILDSNAQKTWLVATESALYCVFDILEENGPRVKWRLSKKNFIVEGKVDLRTELRESQHVSGNHGFVVIGKQNPRKYSKKLFTLIPIEEQIHQLIQKTL
jgi:hypothetical protein